MVYNILDYLTYNKSNGFFNDNDPNKYIPASILRFDCKEQSNKDFEHCCILEYGYSS
jgi:hypothetical protein